MLTGLLDSSGIDWEGWRYLEKLSLAGDSGFSGSSTKDTDFLLRLMDLLSDCRLGLGVSILSSVALRGVCFSRLRVKRGWGVQSCRRGLGIMGR